jgi:hypothetical protein
MTTDDMKARTPAPEVEVVAWMDRDVAWDVISDVHKKRWSEINGPEGTQRYSRPLYASPVVPVGVSRGEIAAGDIIVCKRHGKWMADVVGDTAHSGGWSSPVDAVRGVKKYADAILAALRPTDTGRE